MTGGLIYLYVHCGELLGHFPPSAHSKPLLVNQWTLIAGRVKTILGLALDYYSIQRTLCDGIAAPNITARCQSEIERVERQFDECMVFLLRVRDTPHLVAPPNCVCTREPLLHKMNRVVLVLTSSLWGR